MLDNGMIDKITMLSEREKERCSGPKVREFLEMLTRGIDNTGEFAVAEIRKDDWPEGVSMVISIDRGFARNLADFSDFLSRANIVESSLHIPCSDIILRPPYNILAEINPGVEVFLCKPAAFSLNDNFHRVDADAEYALSDLRRKDAEAGYMAQEGAAGDMAVDRHISIDIDGEGISFAPFMLSARQDKVFGNGPYTVKFGREEFRAKMESVFRELPTLRM